MLTYYLDIEKALLQTRAQIGALKAQVTDDYDINTNYSDALNLLFTVERKLRRMLVAHKFLKTSPTAFVNGESNVIGMEIIHTIRAYETLNGIAQQYGVTMNDLAGWNNATLADLQAGDQIRIVKDYSFSSQQADIVKRLPIISELGGIEYLGRDASNSFSIDVNGDLRILEPTETVEQGIVNQLTTESGEYPCEEDFGITTLSAELTGTALDNYLKFKITNYLSGDARIESVGDITFTKKDNGRSISLAVTTIDKQSLTVQV